MIISRASWLEWWESGRLQSISSIYEKKFQCKIFISLFLLTYFFSQRDNSQVLWSNMNDGREAGCNVCVSICENLFLVQDYEVPVSFNIFLSQKDNFQALWYEW